MGTVDAIQASSGAHAPPRWRFPWLVGGVQTQAETPGMLKYREAAVQWPPEKALQRAVVHLAQLTAQSFGVAWPLEERPKGHPWHGPPGLRPMATPLAGTGNG